MAERNCGNRLGLSESTRVVTGYSDEVADEINGKGAKKVFSLEGIRFYECPISYISEEAAGIIRNIFLSEASGALLFEGGLGDQPCWFIEAYEIYRMERTRNLRENKDGR